jgi:serine/threonine-protein kinase
MKELALNNTKLDGRYEIRHELGRGSYAEIFVAHDMHAAPQSPHSLVVVKALNVFLQDDLDADLERTLVENFQNEAIALDRVRHPNIISRLGHGTARDSRNTVFHYLILEYLPGGDLAKTCREKGLSLTKALFYLEQVCAGLGYAHKMGVIHRDIKPQNLLLTADRQTVKIADFGVARVSQSDSPITRVGTNMFAPPEHSPMLSGNTGTLAFTQLTPAADIYSLAKSAYVLITCESPRVFSNQPITELPDAIRQKPWANDLLQVLEKATQIDSRQRYQTVNDFWLDLARIKNLAEAEDTGEALTEIRERQIPHAIPQPHVAKGYSPIAPQLPHFKTSDDIQVNSQTPALANAPLVVKLNGSQQTAQKSPQLSSQRIENQKVVAEEIIYQPRRKRSFFRRFPAFVIVIGLFAGLLYATSLFLNGRSIFPTFGSFYKKQTGITKTDVFLRPTAGTEGDPRGVVPQNSRVRIVNSKDNWYEIDVVEFSRPKENPSDAEHGWVNKRYIDVQE